MGASYYNSEGDCMWSLLVCFFLCTFPIMLLALFHDRSLGILLGGDRRTNTAAVTFTTAGGGFPKDFSSVRLA